MIEILQNGVLVLFRYALVTYMATIVAIMETRRLKCRSKNGIDILYDNHVNTTIYRCSVF